MGIHTHSPHTLILTTSPKNYGALIQVYEENEIDPTDVLPNFTCTLHNNSFIIGSPFVFTLRAGDIRTPSPSKFKYTLKAAVACNNSVLIG